MPIALPILSASGERLGAFDLAPSKVIGVGLNYRDHAAEMRLELPQEPVLFLKPPSSLISSGECIVLPTGYRRVDFEGELAVIVGKECRSIAPQQAADHILGFTCANDVSVRELQKRDGQWTRAKGFDTFCPIGPHICQVSDPTQLSLTTLQNGEVRQSSNTNQMIFNVFEVVAFVSRVMTLCAGDVIITGTPAGVGPMRVGDTIEVSIEAVGTLSNPVVSSPPFVKS